MQRVSAVILSICLSGCGLSSVVIKSEAMSYDDVIAETTDKLLLLNILRARDKAPLHFANIPLIHESVQQTASLQAVTSFGAQHGSTSRDNSTAGVNIQMAPSFDIVHLDSKDFVTGISSAIDAKFVKYWLDRGLDRRIVLLLFFSSVEIIETDSKAAQRKRITIMNSPREAIEVIRNRKKALDLPTALRCDTQSDFERYLKLINSLKRFFANLYTERQTLAKGFKLDLITDTKGLQILATLDPAKVKLVYSKNEKDEDIYSLYAMSNEQKAAFCYYQDDPSAGQSASQYTQIGAGATPASDKKSCVQSVVNAPIEDAKQADMVESQIFSPPLAKAGEANPVREVSPYCSIFNAFANEPHGSHDPKLELILNIRSVGEIIQFLGDLLEYQDEVRKHLEENPQLRLRINTPVTFGYCGDNPSPGCDDIFFDVREGSCNSRFTLTYRGTQYSIANFNPRREPDLTCQRDASTRNDHSLEILAVVQQLVALNRSAQDLRLTPFVQVLP
jgi:hypothetical protein